MQVLFEAGYKQARITKSTEETVLQNQASCVCMCLWATALTQMCILLNWYV